MPQKSSFVHYPDFTFDSAEFGTLLSDHMSMGMLENARKKIVALEDKEPSGIVDLLISLIVETESEVDLTREMAARLAVEEREVFAVEFISRNESLLKKAAPRQDGETATMYLGRTLEACLGQIFEMPQWLKAAEPPAWMKDFNNPAWVKKLQAPEWSKSMKGFLGDDAMRALAKNDALFKSIGRFEAIASPSGMTAKKIADLDRHMGATARKIPAEALEPRRIETDRDFGKLIAKMPPSEARITNEKLDEVISRLAELKDFEGRSVAIIQSIGQVADTLFQRFTENAAASQIAAEANNQMARDALDAGKLNVIFARRAVYASLASIFVAILIGIVPIIVQRSQASDEDKKSEATIERILHQIDGVQSSISGNLAGLTDQGKQDSAALERRLTEMLDELRKGHGQPGQQINSQP